MSRIKKCIIAFVLLVCMLFTVTTSALAATNIATIAMGQKWKFSADYFGPGKKLSSVVASSEFSEGRYFRALLNPYGTNTTGCYASVTQSTSR